MIDNSINDRLCRIEKLLVGTKVFLTPEELAEYINMSKSTIYKLVQRKILPFAKPNGKHLFFERKKIDEWVLSSQHKSKLESKRDAEKYVYSKNKKA